METSFRKMENFFEAGEADDFGDQKKGRELGEMDPATRTGDYL